MTPAPFFSDVASGPEGGFAVWAKAPDGVRLRLGIWPRAGAKGTVFLLPGRTEYIEKYGVAAGDLAQRGYSVISIDFRGQGLADRATDDPMTGHVESFDEYQRDMETMLDTAQRHNLPQPYFILSHSMGGCIALRTLMGAHPFRAAAFSAPMWGIALSSWMRPVAGVITAVSSLFGLSHLYAPGTGAKTYVTDAQFMGNVLTTDPDMWKYMKRQAEAHPELSLGGPSLAWGRAALLECHALSLMTSPALPAYTALGTAEKVVDPMPVHARMAIWAGSKLDLFTGAEHEIMMEGPDARARFFDSACALFAAQDETV
ncbi:MAG: alpha/beta hydrolase [Cypionkella sp.]|nr:alpha/beta hydrolase [Cypionkella sp.]